MLDAQRAVKAEEAAFLSAAPLPPRISRYVSATACLRAKMELHYLQVAEAKGCRDLAKAPESKAAISGTLVYHKITYKVHVTPDHAAADCSFHCVHSSLVAQHLVQLCACVRRLLPCCDSLLITSALCVADFMQEGRVSLQHPVRTAQWPHRWDAQEEGSAAAG